MTGSTLRTMGPAPVRTPAARGRASIGSAIRLPFYGSGWYSVYGNTFGSVGPVIYDGSPLAQTQATTWTSPALSPGQNRLAVRASNANGEEKNRDAVVVITLDSSGNDISNLPIAPFGLRAFPQGSGAIKVEWHTPNNLGARLPTQFNVYVGTGTPSYTSPAATVLYASGIYGRFQATISGLSAGTYAIGVRAQNASGIEQNSAYVSATASGSGPSAVQSLTVTTVV